MQNISDICTFQFLYMGNHDRKLVDDGALLIETSICPSILYNLTLYRTFSPSQDMHVFDL